MSKKKVWYAKELAHTLLNSAKPGKTTKQSRRNSFPFNNDSNHSLQSITAGQSANNSGPGIQH